MPTFDWESLFHAQLVALDTNHLLRKRRIVRPIDSVHVAIDGRTLLNFASNDYLGLTHHAAVKAAMVESVAKFGVGSGAAPLISGYTDAHASAEQAVARWKGTEAAVLFSSGYQANIALVQMLASVGAEAVGEQPAGRVRFLLDKLCHASLVDAVRGVSNQEGAVSFRVFPHNGLAKLDRLLQDGQAAQSRDVIVTESIYSMDGDAADLPSIVDLRRRHFTASDASTAGAPLLVVDEAHGSGVYGPAGAGLIAELGLTGQIDATVVTFSKALGVIGAAVCGSKTLCDALINYGRGYIFSTSMPAAVAAAAEAAIGVLAAEPHRQKRVRALAKYVRAELTSLGYELPTGDSPIIPIIIGSEADALSAARSLYDQGLLALAIRPPTVPRGASRLRITLSSEHSDEQIARLLSALRL